MDTIKIPRAPPQDLSRDVKMWIHETQRIVARDLFLETFQLPLSLGPCNLFVELQTPQNQCISRPFAMLCACVHFIRGGGCQ